MASMNKNKPYKVKVLSLGLSVVTFINNKHGTLHNRQRLKHLSGHEKTCVTQKTLLQERSSPGSNVHCLGEKKRGVFLDRFQSSRDVIASNSVVRPGHPS